MRCFATIFLSTVFLAALCIATEFVVYPKDGKNKDALKTTEDYIKKTAHLDKIFSYTDFNNVLLLWMANLTEAQVNDIKKQEGVAGAEEDKEIAEAEAAAIVPLTPTKVAVQQPDKVKRAVEYTHQSPAGIELKMISQPPTIPSWRDLQRYVYENHAGKNIYIYHVELGIETRITDEFPSNQVEVLQSTLSLFNQDDPTKDGSDDGHSTGTASKTIGQKWGSSKKATLVVVKMHNMGLTEAATVFDTVWKDIEKKKRQKKSVVTYSLGSRNSVPNRDPNNQETPWKYQRDQIKNLLNNDVPVIVAAGNHAKEGGRQEVDTSPAINAAPDFPLVVVGATNYDGEIAGFSQTGDKVSIYGGGVAIQCSKKDGTQRIWQGTSFSAPLVAGVLANFLAYDEVPFDTSNGKLAAAAKQFLMDKANWARKKNVPLIWNLVEEKDNPKEESPSTPTPPTVPPVNPPSQPSCVANPAKAPRDAHEESLKRDTSYFCSQWAKDMVDGPVDIKHAVADKVVTSGRAPPVFVPVEYEGNDIRNDVYDISVTSVPKCTPDGGKFNLGEPVKAHKCSDLLYNAWKDCKSNQGRGGQITAGCLVYAVKTRY